MILKLALHGITWVAVVLWGTVTYFFLCEVTTGQTIGKRASGLRVVGRDGAPAKANSVAARNVIRIFEEPFIALIALVASGRRRQRIGDLAGSTTVGRAEHSTRPRPSRLRIVYPAIWAISGLVFVLVLSAAPRHSAGSTQSSYVPPLSRLTPEQNAYLKRVERVCRRHSDHVVESWSISPQRQFEIERWYSRRYAEVQAPPTMAALRRQLLKGRRAVDERASRALRISKHSAHPLKTYLHITVSTQTPQIARSFRVLEETGVVCAVA